MCIIFYSQGWSYCSCVLLIFPPLLLYVSLWPYVPAAYAPAGNVEHIPWVVRFPQVCSRSCLFVTPVLKLGFSSVALAPFRDARILSAILYVVLKDTGSDEQSLLRPKLSACLHFIASRSDIVFHTCLPSYGLVERDGTRWCDPFAKF